MSILPLASVISLIILFNFSDNSSSSSLFAPEIDCFIDIKSFVLSDINFISLCDFEIKVEKSSIESFSLFDEFSESISSLFGMGIPFCFASYYY